MKSDIKPNFQNVAVFHNILFPFEANQSFGAAGGLIAVGDHIFIGDDFRPDESAFEVGMNRARGFLRV